MGAKWLRNAAAAADGDDEDDGDDGADGGVPRVVQVSRECTGINASLIGFGHGGWTLERAV